MHCGSIPESVENGRKKKRKGKIIPKREGGGREEKEEGKVSFVHCRASPGLGV